MVGNSALENLGEVQAFYDKNAQNEWDRLDRHRTEFAVTLRALKDYLPHLPAAVLDVGGGPGRYSIALAKLGHRVTLLDLSEGCLQLAQTKAKEEGVNLTGCLRGNAIDLHRFKDGSFDVVLLMGPLYHLLDMDGRDRAVKETHRVLKQNGLVFASFITRYAPLRWSAKSEPEWLSQGKELLETGVWRPSTTGIPSRARVGFTSSYFAHPTEIRPLMKRNGFQDLDLIGCEGAVSMIEEKINELKGDEFDFWVDLNYRLGKDPSLHGAAEHLLYIGRKRLKESSQNK
jgi:S-adenosylmethionine-dependent methyltransferase